jgi:hypothetical protein
MKTAGGIIALIAGIFGIFAAGGTLMIGGFGGAVEADGAETVVWLGFGGVFFSFLTIVLGAVALGVNSKKTGVALIITAILGMVLGGTFVALFMVLALLGGILVVIGAGSKTAAQPTTSTSP